MKHLLFFLLLFSIEIKCQRGWYLLPNSPAHNFRHDDVFFIDEHSGWVINVGGEVWKTNNGGNTWSKIALQSTSFRCIGFIDSLRGFIGNLGPGRWASTTDTNCLYKTTDGGHTWSIVTNIIGPKPKGICGLRVVNDSVIVGCGRVAGPSFFIRSTDGGNTWHSKNMNQYAGMLIDVHFISPDTGFVVGGTDSMETHTKVIILGTTDGGNTWTTKIIGSKFGHHGWKIERARRNKRNIHVSVEQSSYDSLHYFRSIDNGQTWTEAINGLYYWQSQGLGFLSDSIGWIGGSYNSIVTTDAGQTFSYTTVFNALNRMRFVSDTTGYAVGNRVYKYGTIPANAITEIKDPKGYSLEQNTPNPFSHSTQIKFSIPKTEHIQLEIYDSAGRKIKTLLDEKRKAGMHTIEFRLPEAADAIFICVMNAGGYCKLIRMISVKN